MAMMLLCCTATGIIPIEKVEGLLLHILQSVLTFMQSEFSNGRFSSSAQDQEFKRSYQC